MLLPAEVPGLELPSPAFFHFRRILFPEKAMIPANEQTARFRLNPRVIQMIVVLMVALAVPVTLVVLGLRSMAGHSSGPAPEVEGLRTSLESAADKHFPPPENLGGGRRFVFKAVTDASAQPSLLEQAAAAVGGVAISSRQEDGSTRILIRVPPESSEYFERTSLEPCTESVLPGEPTQNSGLYEVLIPSP